MTSSWEEDDARDIAHAANFIKGLLRNEGYFCVGKVPASGQWEAKLIFEKKGLLLRALLTAPVSGIDTFVYRYLFFELSHCGEFITITPYMCDEYEADNPVGSKYRNLPVRADGHPYPLDKYFRYKLQSSNCRSYHDLATYLEKVLDEIHC